MHLTSDSNPAIDIMHLIALYYALTTILNVRWLPGHIKPSTVFYCHFYNSSGQSHANSANSHEPEDHSRGFFAWMLLYFSDIVFFILAMCFTWFLRHKYAILANTKPVHTLLFFGKIRRYLGRFSTSMCELLVTSLLIDHLSRLSSHCGRHHSGIKVQLFEYLDYIQIAFVVICNIRPLIFRLISLSTFCILSPNAAELIMVTLISYVFTLDYLETTREQIMMKFTRSSYQAFGFSTAFVFYLCIFILYFRQTIFEHWLFQRYFKDAYTLLLALCCGYIIEMLIFSCKNLLF